MVLTLATLRILLKVCGDFCRVRPQNGREKVDMCQVCTSVLPDTRQVVLGKDKAFTFDYVYDIATVQENIYNTCVRELIDG